MDQRLVRGEKTRIACALHAAALASMNGLSGLSIGSVALASSKSKASVQSAFSSKEALQIAAIRAASTLFASQVVAPALEAHDAASRLWGLIDGYIDYVSRRALPGGCFMAATLADLDSCPGPVRDRLIRMRRDWLQLLEVEIEAAQNAGNVPALPTADLVAFEIDALLAAANISRNLYDDVDQLARARALISSRLTNECART